MPDITMCKGDGCCIKQYCKRFISKPDVHQSYFVSSPCVEGNSLQCEMYWGVQQDSIVDVLEKAVSK